ncbi:BBE domain-containing protein [Microbacterium sp. HA-8]|uniref:BBE domain-containing protein n=1 Tax=unclassified Microbacterium TaxID=2609290 RepID=UPI0025EB1AC0|nr:BBE domain-containing protein [Microbacterium sp.]
MDPPEPSGAVAHHALVAELSDAAIDALLAVAGPEAQSLVMSVELRHLGGALAAPQGGATSRLDAAYLLFALAMAPTPEFVAAGTEATRAVVAALAPWASRQHFLNFADHTIDVETAFDAESWERLVRVRESVDPDRVWVAAHPVGAA